MKSNSNFSDTFTGYFVAESITFGVLINSTICLLTVENGKLTLYNPSVTQYLSTPIQADTWYSFAVRGYNTNLGTLYALYNKFRYLFERQSSC